MNPQKTVVHVVGARPNYMKVAPVMAALNSESRLRQVLVNTGQHYDEAMAGGFLFPRRMRMWYSYRGSRYRIGYAESGDGIVWTRKDLESVLEVSDSGWDSEMVTYPLVINHNKRLHMLYIGNGDGLTGIGRASSVGM